MTARIFLFTALLASVLISTGAEAQWGRGRVRVRIGAGHVIGRPRGQRTSSRAPLPRFEPSVNVSFGYGFPNLDKNYLTDFIGVARGGSSQKGPFTGSIDYRFSRNLGIGVLVTHGTVSAPYYDAFAGTPLFTGRLDNWSFMLNLMRYITAGKKVTPYFRTALGVNSWKQNYTDAGGNKVQVLTPELPDFAYQVGFGAMFKLSKNAGLFLEAGYGKYILNGGLSFKF